MTSIATARSPIFDRTKHLREDSRRLLWSVLIDEQPPRAGERLVECSDQLVGDLAQRLGLVRELAHVVAVVDGAPAKALTRMHDDAVVAGHCDRDLVDTRIDGDVTARRRRPHRVRRALRFDQAPARDRNIDEAARRAQRRRRQRQHRCLLVNELRRHARIEPRKQRRADRREVRAGSYERGTR